MRTRLRAIIKRETVVSARNFIASLLNRLPYFLPSSMAETENQSSNLTENSPKFDPSMPSIPISYPIGTLEELESRTYFDSFHYPFNRASVPLPSYANSELPNRSRLLVCHDMAGGYLEDKWVQGGRDSDAYSIWHWYLMDVFVYFSHDLVTLPPPCWTNAAHKHGVKVLGTFITEWDRGREICNQLLSTKESAHMYAERLSELAVELGFDGWLINMENKLDQGQIPNLKEFVVHLTQTMHSSKPGSLVIWYDSVTIYGDLDWQDQLNDKNKPFFDLCDGIFVNYTWEEDYPKLSAAVAGNRKFDVYFGIDVFGRNTFGGGQWNTNIALDVIKKDDVSAAIFAPGWVYETKQPPDFQTAQQWPFFIRDGGNLVMQRWIKDPVISFEVLAFGTTTWWALIEKSWGVAHGYPITIPFYSNFDQGHGQHLSTNGRRVSNATWFNLSCQSLQPFLEFPEATDANGIQVRVNFEEASYDGGGNITFSGDLENEAYFTTRLFLGNLLFGNLPLQFTFSFKSDGNALMGLSLELTSPTNERVVILLAAHGNTLFTMNKFSGIFSEVVMPHQVPDPNSPKSWTILEYILTTKEGYTLTEIGAVCYKLDPVVRIPSDFYAILGHLMIKIPDHNFVFPPSTSWIVEAGSVKWGNGSDNTKSVSLKIVWILKDRYVYSSLFQKYNIYVEKMLGKADDCSSAVEEAVVKVAVQDYVGAAHVEAFYVSELPVPYGTSSVKFIIQACGDDGSCQDLDLCPSLELDVDG